MQELSLPDFLSRHAAFDAAIEATPGIDRYCSSLDWILPAHEALHPPREPWVRAGEEGFAVFARRADRRLGRVLEPLELMWGFDCPLIGPDPRRIVRGFVADCARREGEWTLAVLSGVPADSPLLRAILEEAGTRWRVAVGELLPRFTASIRDGVDGWLARRSPKFRRNLRQAERRAAEAGVEFERVGGVSTAAVAPLYERILALETRSWKGLEGVGVDEGRMAEFYRRMIARLVGRRGFRAILARIDHADAGYLHGATHGALFRGLQFSYTETHAALSLGNLMQLRMLEWLCEDRFEWYDLGWPMAYKQRWAEPGIETVTVYVMNQGYQRRR